MNIALHGTEKEVIRVSVDGAPSHSFDSAPLAVEEQRPGVAFLREPAREGRRLFAALFPPDSVARRGLADLDARPEPGLITLVSHPDIRPVPWEYLCDEQGRFLVARHRFTRGLPSDGRRDSPRDVPASQLQILAVPADPLCHRDGTPEVRIDVVGAVGDLAETVRASGAPFQLRAIVPPTLDHLRLGMSDRPLTILHFLGRTHGQRPRTHDQCPRTQPTADGRDQSPHGRVSLDAGDAADIDPDAAPPVLLFEDQAGMVDPVTAERLLVGLGERILLVVLGADASVGDLAQRLVSGGVAYALEMQWTLGRASSVAGRFLRPFYRCLAMGRSVEEATRQARKGLASTPGLLGLPVLYAAHAGEGGRIRIDDKGEADVDPDRLRSAASADVRLWPPQPDLVGLPAPAHFRGYRCHVALLGTHWWDGAPVVTILGGYGVGKTALAMQAAHRFRWRFPQGVLGLSLDPTPKPAVLLTRLAEWVWEGDYDRRWSQDRLLDELADRLRGQERLLVLDGYEALHPEQSTEDDGLAKIVRRLVCRLLGGETRVLLTGREVVGLSGEETVYLDGLSPEAGAALLRALIPGGRWQVDSGTDVYADIDRASADIDRASADPEEGDLQELSRAVGGHPLALELLAGAYAGGQGSLVQLKRRLDDRLQAHERTHDQPNVAACLATAMDSLPPAPRALAPRLTLFRAPFLGGIAAAVFDDRDVPHHLEVLAEAHLIRPLTVGGLDDETAVYQLHPVVRQLLEPQVKPAELEAPRLRFVATYTLFAAAALQRFTVPVSRLVGLLLPDLDRALEWADEEQWSELAFNLAGLWRQYGRVDEALQLYRDVLAAADALGDHRKGAATQAMIGQALIRRGEHREALQALLNALSTLTRLQATSDAARVAQIIGVLRREMGSARFQTLWDEVTGDQSLPVWLTEA